MTPLETLRKHVTGKIESGQATAIVEMPAKHVTLNQMDKMTTNEQTETFTDWKKRAAMEFAIAAKEKGFAAYIAERGNYGFYTNGEKVVSFQLDLFLSLSGNYKASRESGTGWRITDNAGFEHIEPAINASAPHWANKSPIYTTPEKYLEAYQSSSNFTQI
jgi:hypothetical protein